MTEQPAIGDRRYVRRLAANARHGPVLRPDDVLFVEEWDGRQWQPIGETTGGELLSRRDQPDDT